MHFTESLVLLYFYVNVETRSQREMAQALGITFILNVKAAEGWIEFRMKN
jgi:hypothetical protein